MTVQEFSANIIAKGEVKDVYWVACGGSVIDLYPAHCLLQAKSAAISSHIYTAAEFLAAKPAKLSSTSLVVSCSHSGNTREAIEATALAAEAGAQVLTMTNNSDAKINSFGWPCWVYEWKDETPQDARPAGFSLLLVADLLAAFDGIDLREDFKSGLKQLDGILAEAMPRLRKELGPRFVKFCQDNKFFYVLGSGPVFCQTYGFAICSLMEMQRQHCAYVNSAEYFHGPFEVTEPGVAYFLQKSSGATRAIDERAERFLVEHTDELIVLDSSDFGVDKLPAEALSYLDAIFFYECNVALREERGLAFNFHPDTRRYMGKVSY